MVPLSLTSTTLLIRIRWSLAGSVLAAPLSSPRDVSNAEVNKNGDFDDKNKSKHTQMLSTTMGMHQLIRGVGRSGSLLRASRQLHSAVATTLGGIINQNLIPLTSSLISRRNVVPTLVSAQPYYRVVDRNLSSMHAATTATIGEDASTAIQRPPSALEQATLEEITPGHAIFVLQKFASEANGNKLIRQSDFVTLCESARPGKMRDAKVIATAMKEFKRCNRFVLQSVGSKAAVDGILRSMTPTWKVQDGKPRVRAALFAAEQIVDETTGLYFAVETATVDKVLEELHKGLLEMQENRMKVTIDNIDDETVGEDIRTDVKLAKDALRLTGDMINQLIKRRSRPERDMNKRRKNLYLKRLQIGGGPRRSTLQLGTKISLLIGGTTAAQTNIIEPFEAAWWTSFVDEDALQLIADAKELERQMPVSAIAATVDDVGEEESTEIEEADGIAGDEKDIADDVELDEVDESKQEDVVEAGEEKK